MIFGFNVPHSLVSRFWITIRVFIITGSVVQLLFHSMSKGPLNCQIIAVKVSDVIMYVGALSTFATVRYCAYLTVVICAAQVSQLGAAAQKYQAATQNASSNLSVPELQNNCNM